jgi:CRP-like cAMP-binding protein
MIIVSLSLAVREEWEVDGMKLTDALATCGLFSCMNQEHLQRVEPLCNRWTTDDNALLFRQGQPARALYVVEKGKASLELSLRHHEGESLAHPATVATVGPGEAFGWSAIVQPHFMTLSARAIGPSSFILIDGMTLTEVLRKHKDMGFIFMEALCRLLAERLMQTREILIYERGGAMRA